MNEVRGRIFDLQRSATQDGPGIRTAVFLQGCPLKCLWCHNPESWSMSGGREVTVGEVMETVRRDIDYFELSGGGLTVSGGEPCAQPRFTEALLTAARGLGVHTCLDTSGAAPLSVIERLRPHVDLWLFDMKASERTEELIGDSGARIEATYDLLARTGAQVRLRCPLVPGINDSDAHLQRIAERSHQVVGVDLMPYHTTGVHKWKDYPLQDTPAATEADVRRWKTKLQEFGAVRVSD